MNRTPHIASRIFNTPLLIAPAKLDAIVAGLGSRILGGALDLQPNALTTAQGEWKKPGYDVIDGVARLDIFGVLTHRGSMEMDTSSYLQGYQDIARKFAAALADTDVHAVVLNMDSPGGEVSGAFDLAERIYAARGPKPIHAVASDMAASACYLLASAADKIYVTPTASVGSIGVVMRHVDFSAALAQDGIKVTHIFAGDHKIDGNPFEALPEAVRAGFQRDIDALYSLFVSAVASHRGMPTEAVRATQAGMFMGQKALDARLADAIATPDQVIAELAATGPKRNPQRAVARATSQKRKPLMAHEDQGGANATAEFTQADLERARAEGHAAGLDAGMKAERERAAAIMGCEAAKGREALASALVAQGIGAEQAAVILAASPVAAPAQAHAGGFAAAMAALGNPAVTADAGSTSEPDGHAVIQASWAKAFGTPATAQ